MPWMGWGGPSGGLLSTYYFVELTAFAVWLTLWWLPLVAWWTTSTRPQASASSTSVSW